MPTVPDRQPHLKRLLDRLAPQLTPDVSVLVYLTDRPRRADNGKAQPELSVGFKRQCLIECATADWVCMFDDDDRPSSDYCARVLNVIDGDEPPDVVGFRLRYYVLGRIDGEAVISYDAARIPKPNLRPGMSEYNRVPNHLSPVRREFALRAGYKMLNYGEDADYARRLELLKPREKFIDAYLYDYLYDPTKIA